MSLWAFSPLQAAAALDAPAVAEAPESLAGDAETRTWRARARTFTAAALAAAALAVGEQDALASPAAEPTGPSHASQPYHVLVDTQPGVPTLFTDEGDVVAPTVVTIVDPEPGVLVQGPWRPYVGASVFTDDPERVDQPPSPEGPSYASQPYHVLVDTQPGVPTLFTEQGDVVVVAAAPSIVDPEAGGLLPLPWVHDYFVLHPNFMDGGSELLMLPAEDVGAAPLAAGVRTWRHQLFTDEGPVIATVAPAVVLSDDGGVVARARAPQRVRPQPPTESGDQLPLAPPVESQVGSGVTARAVRPARTIAQPPTESGDQIPTPTIVDPATDDTVTVRYPRPRWDRVARALLVDDTLVVVGGTVGLPGPHPLTVTLTALDKTATVIAQVSTAEHTALLKTATLES